MIRSSNELLFFIYFIGDNMEEYELVKKYLNKNKKEEINYKRIIYNFISRCLLSCLILLITLCVIKVNPKIKTFIKENVYNKNISFSKINKEYEKVFGKIYPTIDNKKTEPVFNETFSYKSKEKYKEGVKLIVDNNYLMPVLESGIVVYIGDKDNYGHTIIIQQVNGIDLWYVGLKNTNIKLYDYIEKGKLLGEVDTNEVYLFYQKEGKFIDYQEYLG